jgi:plastocyanin
MMIVAGIALLLIVVASLAATTQTGGRGTTSARDRLDARLASGEITPDEHRQRRQVLTDVPAGRAPRGMWWLLGGLGAVLLVVAPLMAGVGTGSGWWSGHRMDTADHLSQNRSAAAPAEPPVSGAPEVTVVAGDLYFAPATVEVEAGTTVNLVLDNTGQVFHDLSIPELELHLEAGAGDTAATAFRTPPAGTYELLCTVPGHAPGGMRGELLVTATS